MRASWARGIAYTGVMVTSRERPKRAAKPKAGTKARRTPSKRMTLTDKIIALGDKIPDVDIATFPSDGAAQHDHYIYGTPKRR